MFDHRHYVPVLKAKKGELVGLERLDPAVGQAMTPLLEVPPIPWDFVADGPAKTIDAHLPPVSNQIQRHWGTRAFFLDTLYLDDNDRLADGRTPAAAVLEECRVAALSAIPVTGVGRGATHHADVAAAVALDGRGAAIRVVAEDL